MTILLRDLAVILAVDRRDWRSADIDQPDPAESPPAPD